MAGIQGADANPMGTVLHGSDLLKAIEDIQFDGDKLVIHGDLEIEGHLEADTKFKLDTSIITSSEISVLDEAIIGSGTANKVLILDSNKDISGIRFLSLSGISGNLNINAGGALNLIDDTDGDFVSLKSSTNSITHTLTLPPSGGNPGQLLQTDGSGNLNWVSYSQGSGTFTGISGVTAGTGLNGGGTSGSVTLNIKLSDYEALNLGDVTPVDGDKIFMLHSVSGGNKYEQLTSIDKIATRFSGTGLSASGSIINIESDQTVITSILNENITKIGTAADGEYVSFETTDEINMMINNSSLLKVNTSGVNITGSFTTGNTTISGTLDVTGATGVDGDFDIATDKFTVASLTGNTAVAGTLDVTGATGVDGDFDIATDKFTISSATGNTTVAGTLDF